ncbi:hypothetical protein KFK09_018252 [Dendrobium nobile]|uniref:Uncharacterized protein n=1 Tax=Dendrobium nobile TaxID=94219 RepID=A0A8T3AVF8_DENNO|nr:hypothetical protein KFK09_018252 [Dendrobium nobile]
MRGSTLTRAEEDSSRKERETSLHDALGSLFDFICPTTPPVAGILAPELADRQLALRPAIRPHNRFFWLPPCTTQPNQTPHAVDSPISLSNSPFQPLKRNGAALCFGHQRGKSYWLLHLSATTVRGRKAKGNGILFFSLEHAELNQRITLWTKQKKEKLRAGQSNSHMTPSQASYSRF